MPKKRKGNRQIGQKYIMVHLDPNIKYIEFEKLIF